MSPHLLPLLLCCARLGGGTVNRCPVENSQGEVSPPAPSSLCMDPRQRQNWAFFSRRSPVSGKKFPRLNVWCLSPRAEINPVDNLGFGCY